MDSIFALNPIFFCDTIGAGIFAEAVHITSTTHDSWLAIFTVFCSIECKKKNCRELARFASWNAWLLHLVPHPAVLESLAYRVRDGFKMRVCVDGTVEYEYYIVAGAEKNGL